MSMDVVDLLVVGGGINGAGIARDAAGRGLSVVLCEQDDLAAHTSSASTKLIHGGLRYLEHYEFGLVRKSLIEREVLLRAAPHIMWPLRFVMPHDPSMRPAWMIRLGVFLYDHLARRELLPGSQSIRLAGHPAGVPLKPRFARGFAYSDGWVDDARLVVLCAVDAAERGAVVRTRTRCEQARRDADGWQARLVDAAGATTVRARALVNAAGPWAERFLRDAADRADTRALRLVKGSHIVVPRLYDHPMAYIFQSPDRRIVFAIPYERDFTLIGTTDVEHHGDPGAARISAQEIDYLCELANRYFVRQIDAGDVVHGFAGVRPLLDEGGADGGAADPSAVTRDYALELDAQGAPLLTVWGGKITTFRRLAEEAVDLLAGALGRAAPAWTAQAALPGGDLGGSFEAFCATLATRHPWLPAPMLRRMARAYGSRIERIVGGAHDLADLGEQIAPGLHAAEVRYLMQQEWARSADDILWRRSKLALHLDADARERVRRWVELAAADASGGASGDAGGESGGKSGDASARHPAGARELPCA